MGFAMSNLRDRILNASVLESATRLENRSPVAVALEAVESAMRALQKAREARKMIDASGYPIILEIDGGVKVDNIKEVAEAGVDMFVAGSAIFNTPDYKVTIDKMRAELAMAKR